jgi:hypothetical protein
MTPPRLAGVAATAAAAASLALAGVASANAGQKTFVQTYPRASALCAQVAAGTGPKRLQKASARVLPACTTLQTGFNTAHAAVLAGNAVIAGQKAAVRAESQATCNAAGLHAAACRHARHRRVLAIDALERQRGELARAYFRAVEANRRLFWRSVRGLPGGRDVREDAPIPEQSV